MGRLEDIHKTIAYMRRNGAGAAFFAVKERINDRKTDYTYTNPPDDILEMQRDAYKKWGEAEKRLPKFSIIVPCYNTPEEFLRRMIKSVQAQTYPLWELIIADASSKDNNRSGAGKEKIVVKGTETATEKDIEMVLEKSIDESLDIVQDGVETLCYIDWHENGQKSFYNPDSAENITSVGAIVSGYCSDKRIRYLHLYNNYGISGNSNRALKFADGEYVCLLDHDDILTPDALYENAKIIIEGSCNRNSGSNECCTDNDEMAMIYSDEDKCNSVGSSFFEVNQKPDYNPDYLLSNNYICHLSVFRRDIINTLGFRSKFDGAQDYDLILRTCALDHFEKDKSPVFTKEAFFNNRSRIVHIPKVLYHWRSHAKSTAGNSTAKEYAYTAGQEAVKDLLHRIGICAEVSKLQHVGFYRCNYNDDIFAQRPDLGVVGGRINDCSGALAGGIYTFNGDILYEGLPKGFSGGFQHRAVVQQDAEAVDIRCMLIREELKPLYEECTKHVYGESFWKKTDKSSVIRLSIEFCQEVRKRGWNIIWDPQLSI